MTTPPPPMSLDELTKATDEIHERGTHHAGCADLEAAIFRSHETLRDQRDAAIRRAEEAEKQAARLKEIWLPCDQTVQCAFCDWVDWRPEENPHPTTCPISELETRANAADAAEAQLVVAREALEHCLNRHGHTNGTRDRLRAALGQLAQVRVSFAELRKMSPEEREKALGDLVEAAKRPAKEPANESHSRTLVEQEGSLVRVTALGPQFTKSVGPESAKEPTNLVACGPCSDAGVGPWVLVKHAPPACVAKEPITEPEPAPRHIYQGQCPDDTNGHTARDADCPACSDGMASDRDYHSCDVAELSALREVESAAREAYHWFRDTGGRCLDLKKLATCLSQLDAIRAGREGGGR